MQLVVAGNEIADVGAEVVLLGVRGVEEMVVVGVEELKAKERCRGIEGERAVSRKLYVSCFLKKR
jgi:hypothetical protein